MSTSFTHVVGSCVSKYIVKDGKREKWTWQQEGKVRVF